MRGGLILAMLLAFTLPVAHAAMPTGKLPTTAAPLHYSLQLKIDPRAERFDGSERIRVTLNEASDHLWLHGQDLNITEVSTTDAAGKTIATTATAHAEEGLLEVRFAATLPAQTIELAFTWDAPFNRKLEGLYKVSVGDDAYAITQMEPVSARWAFPSFDEPRFKVPFDISLTVPSQDVAVSNAQQISEKKSDDGQWKTLSFATTSPLPTYLVALAVGPWDVVEGTPIAANSVRKAPLPLRGIGKRGSKQKLDWALKTAAEIVPFFEDYTGQPYPFDKLDLLGAPDFSAGAMENAGLIIYRDAALLADENSGAGQFRGVFNINAHEIAHQWYGDLVTVPWWDDIWLNEAYATWAQAKVAVALHPEYQADLGALEGRLWAMSSDSLLSTRKIRQPIENQGDIQSAFDGITYQKGAAVLAMFEQWVGETTFRKGMREYLASHAFGSGSSDDLIATLSEHSGKGEAFARGMRSFLDQPGVPLISARVQCDAGKATLDLSQSRYLPYQVTEDVQRLWTVPVCVRLGQGDTRTTQCVLLEGKQQQFALEGTCPQWILPNADARGYYRFELEPAALNALGAASAKLSTAEQMMYADALSSSFNRGSLDPVLLLDAMPALARSDAPQVATALVWPMGWIRENLLDAPARATLDAWAVQQYAAKMQTLGWRRVEGEPLTTTTLRSRVVGFLIGAKDPVALKALGEQGRRALGLDGSGTVDLSRADADLLGTALEVAVQSGGAEAYEVARKAFEASRDTRHRYALLGALGSTRDPELAAKARAYGLSDAVQLGEMGMLYGAQMGERENRAATWQWLTQNYDALRKRLSPFAQGGLPGMFSAGRCDAASAKELEDFFAPRVKDLVGGERGLRQTLERIKQCSALREHIDTKPLSNWIKAHAAQP